MEKNKVMILSVTKNEIQIKQKHKKPKYILLCFALIVVFTFFFSIERNSLCDNMLKIYNPVSSLYNDNSDIVFTGGAISNKETLNMIVPVKGATYVIESDGTIIFDIVSSIMVSSCESGVVIDAGTSNNMVKYIKIKHSQSVETLIENVDIIGVKVGDIVKSGQDIATAKLGESVSLKVYNLGVQINNLKISQSKIVWE